MWNGKLEDNVVEKLPDFVFEQGLFSYHPKA